MTLANTVNDEALLTDSNTMPPQLVYDGRGDIRFAELLTELWNLHKNRSAVYGTKEDALSNLHNSAPYKPHVGCIIEGGNIRSRVVNIMAELENGGGVDDIDGVHPIFNAEMDNAAFALLALILLKEEGLI